VQLKRSDLYLIKASNIELRDQLKTCDGQAVMAMGKLRNSGKYLLVTGIKENQAEIVGAEMSELEGPRRKVPPSANG